MKIRLQGFTGLPVTPMMTPVIPFTVMLSIVFIGAGAASAAVVGLRLPENHWVGAGLALVLGAGVGVVVLSVGLFVIGPSTSTGSAQGAFLAASAAGFVAVVAVLALLWRRVRTREDSETK
jgi:hypothetical protein